VDEPGGVVEHPDQRGYGVGQVADADMAECGAGEDRGDRLEPAGGLVEELGFLTGRPAAAVDVS
jgi:hypothetical protein